MSKLEPIECILEENHPPLCERARMMNADKTNWLRQKIDDLVKMGMLEVEPNPIYGAPCFVVPKKGPKRYRMVVDLRLLNKYTRPTACELPHLEQQLLSVGTAQYFCTMDLLHGFDFLPVHPDSTKFFVMTTPFGAYRMKGAPMGWCNTPALFQARIQQEVLLPINLFCTDQTGICQWIDDSLLYSNDFDDALDALKRFLVQLKLKNLRVNISKCAFFQAQVEYCGRLIQAGGTWSFDTKFWTKVARIPPPVTTTDLAQVIYVCQWISTCVPQFSMYREYFEKITGPLNIAKAQLKKKEQNVVWTNDRLRIWEDFQKLLQASAERGLQCLDPSKELVLLTDASQDAWSIVIVQLQGDSELTDDSGLNLLDLAVRPVLFMSGGFTSSQSKWHIGQKELYPIIKSFTRCQHLLLDPTKTLNIVTDHSALKYILRPEKAKRRAHAERLQRWSLILQRLRCRIFVVPSCENAFADLLTRWGYPRVPLALRPPPGTSCDLCTILGLDHKPDPLPEAHGLYQKALGFDPFTDALQKHDFALPFTYAGSTYAPDTFFRTPEQLICLRGEDELGEPIVRLVIPKMLQRKYVEFIHHQNESTCHLGVRATLEEIKRRYFFLGIQVLVQEVIRECEECTRCKLGPKEKLVQTPIGRDRGGVVAMDFLEGLERSYGCPRVLAMRDMTSLFTVLVPVKKRTAEAVIKAFKDHWIVRYGVPSRVHTDNAKEFLSGKFRSFLNEWGVGTSTSAPYAHNQNGGVERFFRWLREQLKILNLKTGSGKKWVEHLGMLAYKYNTMYSRVLGTTPYRVMFGRNPGGDCVGTTNELYRKRVLPMTHQQFKWKIGDLAIVDEANEVRGKAEPNRSEVVEIIALRGNNQALVLGQTTRQSKSVAISQLRRVYF